MGRGQSGHDRHPRYRPRIDDTRQHSRDGSRIQAPPARTSDPGRSRFEQNRTERSEQLFDTLRAIGPSIQTQGNLDVFDNIESRKQFWGLQCVSEIPASKSLDFGSAVFPITLGQINGHRPVDPVQRMETEFPNLPRLACQADDLHQRGLATPGWPLDMAAKATCACGQEYVREGEGKPLVHPVDGMIKVTYYTPPQQSSRVYPDNGAER